MPSRRLGAVRSNSLLDGHMTRPRSNLFAGIVKNAREILADMFSKFFQLAHVANMLLDTELLKVGQEIRILIFNHTLDLTLRLSAEDALESVVDASAHRPTVLLRMSG